MFGSRTILAISLILALNACETKEDVAKRLVQFNGRTLAQVSQVIGPPTLQDKSHAVWFYEATHTEYLPYYRPHLYSHRPGYRGHVHGYGIPQTYYINCTYTASLKFGHVTTSKYKGNSCQRFAPMLKKKHST